jgi:hypothetical protein
MLCYEYDNDMPCDGSKKEQIEEEKDPSTGSTMRGRRFSDDPMNLIDLWNTKAPAGHNRVHTVTDGLKILIRKAYKQVPERHQWEAILQEIEMSEFLCGKKWVTFDWVLKTSKDETVENYAKVMNGNYRNDKTSHISDRTRANIAAAQRVLASFNGDVIEGDSDGQHEGPGGIHQRALTAGGGQPGDLERWLDEALLPGSGTLPAADSAGRADLGPEEPDPLP